MWSLCILSQAIRVTGPSPIDRSWGLLSARAACVGWRSSELPGLPASRDFPDGRRWPRTRCIGFAWGAQIRVVFVHHWCQVKGIWCRGYYCLVILDGSVQCQLLHNRPPARAFCHHTCWAYRWLLLPSRPGLVISLRNCLKKSSSIWQPAIWAPHSDSASSVLQISTVLLQYYYIHYVHYVQALSTRLKLWFWVLFLSLLVLQDWSSFPAISFIFVA